jgi:hypothetical protein
LLLGTDSFPPVRPSFDLFSFDLLAISAHTCAIGSFPVAKFVLGVSSSSRFRRVHALFLGRCVLLEGGIAADLPC